MKIFLILVSTLFIISCNSKNTIKHTPKNVKKPKIILTYNITLSKDDNYNNSIKTIKKRLDTLKIEYQINNKNPKFYINIYKLNGYELSYIKDVVSKVVKLEFMVINNNLDISELAKDINLPKEINLIKSEFFIGSKTIPDVFYQVNYDKYKILENFIKKIKLPLNYKISYELVTNLKHKYYRTYILNKKDSMSGDNIEDSSVTISSWNNLPMILLSFNKEGTILFKNLTKKAKNKKLAIIINDFIVSAPVVNQEIKDGRVQITFGSNQSLKEIKELSFLLKNGSSTTPILLDEKIFK